MEDVKKTYGGGKKIGHLKYSFPILQIHFSDSWSGKLKNVEACIAVKIVPVPCLLEGTVR